MKILKGINFIKVFKIKNLYKLYIIIKNKVNKYKFYIYSKKYLLNLVYSNIIESLIIIIKRENTLLPS